MLAKKAPEYGEGLDPSEEDDDELTCHQVVDERLQLTCISTKYFQSVSHSQVYLQARDPPCVCGWHGASVCKDGFTQFISILNWEEPCFSGKTFQIASSAAPDITSCHTSKCSHLKSINILDTIEEVSIACLQ